LGAGRTALAIGASREGAFLVAALFAAVAGNLLWARWWWRPGVSARWGKGVLALAALAATCLLDYMLVGYNAFGCVDSGPGYWEGYCATLERFFVVQAVVAVAAPLLVLTGAVATTLSGCWGALVVTAAPALSVLSLLVLPFLVLVP